MGRDSGLVGGEVVHDAWHHSRKGLVVVHTLDSHWSVVGAM